MIFRVLDDLSTVLDPLFGPYQENEWENIRTLNINDVRKLKH